MGKLLLLCVLPFYFLFLLLLFVGLVQLYDWRGTGFFFAVLVNIVVIGSLGCDLGSCFQKGHQGFWFRSSRLICVSEACLFSYINIWYNVRLGLIFKAWVLGLRECMIMILSYQTLNINVQIFMACALQMDCVTDILATTKSKVSTHSWFI